MGLVETEERTAAHVMNRVLRIGHRGAMGYAPENSIASFQKALDCKVDMIEFDAIACKTGEVMVFHDERLERLTNGRGYIAKKTYEELRHLKLVNGEKILTLQEVLNFIDKRAKVNIEIKNKRAFRASLHVIEKYVQEKGWSRENFLVSSFMRKKLKKARNLKPGIKRGALLLYRQFRFLQFAKSVDAYSVHINIRLTNNRIVQEAHELGLKVFVWTANENHDIKRLKDLGVDGIFSDYPDRV